MSRYPGDLDCKLYVGDLPRDVSERELEDAFSYYGKLKNVWVARNPPGFAFVEFEDPRDADDAVKGLDGTTLGGGKICVEHSTGKSRPKPWQQGGGPMSRRPAAVRRAFDPNDRCYECGQRGHYAYDCSKRLRRYRNSSRSRSRSASGDRRNGRSVSRSRSRSRSRDNYTRRSHRSRSASNRRSRSRSRS